MGVVRRVHPMLIVPSPVLLKSPFHAWRRGGHPGGAHPVLHGAEEPLDLGVELPSV